MVFCKNLFMASRSEQVRRRTDMCIFVVWVGCLFRALVNGEFESCFVWPGKSFLLQGITNRVWWLKLIDYTGRVPIHDMCEPHQEAFRVELMTLFAFWGMLTILPICWIMAPLLGTKHNFSWLLYVYWMLTLNPMKSYAWNHPDIGQQ